MLRTIAAGLQWRLARIGIRIAVFYWIEEGRKEVSLPPLRNESDFTFGLFEAADLATLGSIEPDAFPQWRIAEMLRQLQNGRLCFGAKIGDEIVAITTVDLDAAKFFGKTICLASHEAYLGDVFTRNEYRGRNIAPHLRFRIHSILRNKGKTKIYSFTDILNAPALRANEKLQVKYLWLGAYIELFRKCSWHWKLRTYDN